ncbi:hypothetical protein C5E10_11675 [Pseudoclavibacter sp. RFBG4]|nr:hypothetical protein C5E10_11675 [Pseudoclavibacter sp. RFBG4]
MTSGKYQLDVNVRGSGKATQEESSERDHSIVRIAMNGIGGMKDTSVGDRFTAGFIDAEIDYPRVTIPDLGTDRGLSTG